MASSSPDLYFLAESLPQNALDDLRKHLTDGSTFVHFPATGSDAARITTGHSGARLEDGQPLFEVSIARVRETLTRLTAAWPRQPLPAGPSFLEAFISEGSLSLWWLTELAQKNNEGRPFFTRLVELNVLREVLGREEWRRVHIAAVDPGLRAVLRQACQARGFPVTVWPRAGGDAPQSLGRLLVSRLWQLRSLVARWAALKVAALIRAGRPPGAATLSERTVVFLSWYPQQWVDWEGARRDRYFVDLPDHVSRVSAWLPSYLLSGYMASLRELWTLRRRLSDLAVEAGAPCDLLEGYLSLRDILDAYLDPRPLVRYLMLERDWRFREIFRWEGIDLFPLARQELIISFATEIPRYLTVARAVRRFVRSRRPLCLVTVLETYSYGRSVIWGARSANTGTRILGFQHSPLSRTQLFYAFRPEELSAPGGSNGAAPNHVHHMPTPDAIAVHSESARALLLESGFREERIWVTGAARFDHLGQFRDLRLRDREGARRALGLPASLAVLVAGVIWPDMTDQLLRTAFGGLALLGDPCVLVKPHPIHRDVAGQVRALANRHALSDVRIVDQSLHSLLAVVDVMITANTTSDAEAVAIGCPVVKLQTGYVDVSPTAELPGSVIMVRSSEELAAAVERAVLEGVRPEVRSAMVDKAFYRLDGGAKDRFVQRLEALPSAVPASLAGTG